MARHYWSPPDGYEKDLKKAFTFYYEGALLGDRGAQTLLARFYDPQNPLGVGIVEQDAKKAKHWNHSSKLVGN